MSLYDILPPVDRDSSQAAITGVTELHVLASATIHNWH